MKMRKWILALAWLLVSASAQAHVSAIPYPDVGSLSDLTHRAAFSIIQTALPSRVQKNLVTDYGASCNTQSATKVVSITSSTNSLTVASGTFVVGDIGKAILIPGAAGSGNLETTITGVSGVGTQTITLNNNASVSLSSASTYLTWGTNDSTAFQAFKAAFQGSTPVQLTLPGMCSYTGFASNGSLWTFRGIQDIIVDGGGVGGIARIGNNQLFLGGVGQYQDNDHSVRTVTANSGDSCVTLKTTPAVTVSAIGPSVPPTSSFTASGSGTTLTVTGTPSGTIVPGATLRTANSGANYMSIVQPYGTAGTTGVGGAGTYAVSQTITFGSQATYTVPASYTASVDLAGVMTVSAVSDGSVAVGLGVYSLNAAFGGAQTNVYIKSQLTGSAGSTGTYQLSASPHTAITSQAFTGEAQIRVTLNSTTGLSTGDTLYLTGILAFGDLQKKSNGLKWIKVVNGTQVDLFQWSYDGLYSSGGTGGGDRTSLFPVGSKVLMTGWSNQSYWARPYGFPSNPHWFEYKTVTSVNSTTHQVCFDTQLANTYKSTWPQMNTGSQFEVDPGGPATLYVMLDWEMTAVFQNLTIDSQLQTLNQGRSITYKTATMIGSGCPIPSQNETFIYLNVTGPDCNMETDKIIKTWNITNSTMKKVHVQSSSLDVMNIDGLTINVWLGTSKRFFANNLTTDCGSTFCPNNNDSSFKVGVDVYGVSDETSCTNCTILGPPGGSPSGTGLGFILGGQEVNNPNRPWSMSGGVMTVPNGYSWDPTVGESELQIKTLVPGHYAFWFGTGAVGRSFKVVDVTQDLDNTYVQTNESGGFPTGAWVTGNLKFTPHPSPLFTMSAQPSSAPSALMMNGCPAQTPFFSCQNYTFTGGAAGASPTLSLQVWGVLDTFTVTNNVPYTNVGALSWRFNQFNQWKILKTDLTQVDFGTSPNGQFDINTKSPSGAGGGTRTLTTSGATGTQSLDNVSAPPTDAWFGKTTQPIFTNNTPSDSPQVTMTLRTNQQLPP